MTNEQKKRLSEAHKGYVASAETRAKMSLARKGKKYALCSLQKKVKISASLKGRKAPWVAQSNRTRAISEKTRQKRSIVGKSVMAKLWSNPEFINRMKGENHPVWIKNRELLQIESLNRPYDTQYKYWMLAVKKRDSWKCRIADSNCRGRLEAHHILPWKEYPNLRYQINNGITLCQAHHPRGWAEVKRLAPDFRRLVTVSSY